MPNHTPHAPKDAFWGLEWPFKGYVFLRPFRPVDVRFTGPDPVRDALHGIIGVCTVVVSRKA